MRTPQALINHSPDSAAMLERPAEDAPVHEPESGLSAAQIITILRFYWKVTILIAAAISIVAAIGIKFLPKTFTATATLIVDSGKKDPLAAQDLPDAGLSNYVATQMELITSPITLLQAVDRMKLTQDPHFSAGYSGSDPAGAREYAARVLAGDIQVDLGRGGQLLYISASAKYAVRAADIANTVASIYIEEERRRSNRPATELAQRYSAEIAELRAKVATAQENLAAFRQHEGITSVTTETGEAGDTETQALTELEQRLLEAQNLRRSLEAKSGAQQASADEVLSSPVVQQLKVQLAAQQTQLAQLLVSDGPNHPKVLELKSQMERTSRQLEDEESTLSENISTELERARQLEKEYTQALAVQRAKVVQERKLQGDGAKLQLELDSAQSVYKRALDGLDQVMFSSAGDNSNVNLISSATPPTKASKPNKLKLLTMGCVLGLLAGLAAPLLFELLLNRRLRCRDDIERSFSIPVLAEFGRITHTRSA